MLHAQVNDAIRPLLLVSISTWNVSASLMGYTLYLQPNAQGPSNSAIPVQSSFSHNRVRFTLDVIIVLILNKPREPSRHLV